MRWDQQLFAFAAEHFAYTGTANADDELHYVSTFVNAEPDYLESVHAKYRQDYYLSSVLSPKSKCAYLSNERVLYLYFYSFIGA